MQETTQAEQGWQIRYSHIRKGQTGGRSEDEEGQRKGAVSKLRLQLRQ